MQVVDTFQTKLEEVKDSVNIYGSMRSLREKYETQEQQQSQPKY